MDLNTSNLASNKSFSAPDISTSGPLFRRVVIEECYFPYTHAMSPSRTLTLPSSPFSNANSLLSLSRHISSDQLATYSSSPNKNCSNWTDRIITSTPMQSTPSETLALENDSPMDVDNINMTVETNQSESSFGKSKKPTILDFVDLTYQGPTAIYRKSKYRKKWVNKQRTSPGKQPRNRYRVPEKKSYRYLKINMTIAVLALIGIPIYDKLNYIRNIDIESFTNDLSNLLIGQDHAIKQLGNALFKFSNGSNTPERHLLSLIGTTGVGKSLCVNIIKRKFMPKQIIEVDVDKFDLVQDKVDIYKTVPYLVIFEDLTYEKVPKVVHILNTLPTEKWILVVSIFNVQETEDTKTFTINRKLYDMIPKELSLLDYHYETIQFQSFDKNFAKHHIQSFGSIYAEFVSNIKNWEQLLSQHDFERVGFKGLLEKMNVLSK